MTFSGLRDWPLKLDDRFAQRSMGLGFLAIAALFILGPWLHPPLSTDIRSQHLSLGLGQGIDPIALLHGPRTVPGDCTSNVLFATILLAVCVVMRRPRELGIAAGLLLISATVVNGAIALNHPTLIEALDREYAQRQQIVAMRTLSPEPNPTVLLNNGRIGLLAAPLADEQPGDLSRGFLYLYAGPWLICWAALGIVLASRGSLARRMRTLGLWTAASLLLTGLACHRRLAAEWHWQEAERHEAACDYARCRQSIDTAIRLFPEFEQMERTWLLAGKADYRLGQVSPQETFFRAFQMQRDRDRLRAYACQQDLPWLIKRTPDYREGLATLPAGFHLTLPAGTAEIGTSDFRTGFVQSKGPLTHAYWAAHPGECRLAIEMLEGLLAGNENDSVPRRAAGRLWVDRGLERYLKAPLFTESGYSFAEQGRQLEGAQWDWQHAAVFVPQQRDWPLYLGTTSARLDPHHLDRAEWELSPVLGLLGDRIIQADALSTLADGYFDAGDFATARRRYAQSFRAFSLPTLINYRAQKGLGGL